MSMLPFSRVPFWVPIFDPRPNGKRSARSLVGETLEENISLGVSEFSHRPIAIPIKPKMVCRG